MKWHVAKQGLTISSRFEFCKLKCEFVEIGLYSNMTIIGSTGGPRYSRTFYLRIRLFTFEK
jgi:hypothetical protein